MRGGSAAPDATDGPTTAPTRPAASPDERRQRRSSSARDEQRKHQQRQCHRAHQREQRWQRVTGPRTGEDVRLFILAGARPLTRERAA